jgi:hypothetical protein
MGASDPHVVLPGRITPAWNNDNLSRLASKIYSPLVLRRGRVSGMPVSEQNVRSSSFARDTIVRKLQ